MSAQHGNRPEYDGVQRPRSPSCNPDPGVTMPRHHRPTAWTLAGLLAAALTACGPGAGAPATAPNTASATASSGTGPATPTDGSTRLCLSGTVQVLYPPADNPLRSSCVHVGTRIVVTLQVRPNYRWAPVVSSAPSVVTVLGNRVAPDGSRAATARAEAPGTTTLSSADTFTPDPHGPPSRAWQLKLRVIP